MLILFFCELVPKTVIQTYNFGKMDELNFVFKQRFLVHEKKIAKLFLLNLILFL